MNPNSVLLLDEPDAHLEILRQRQIYELLTTTARQHNSQLIMASHSEIILEEAADRDVVVAFVGAPHRIDGRGSQVAKSLKSIGFDQYYQAEITGWALYLEGATDLAILRAFAENLEHRAVEVLQRPFVHYVENQTQKERDHFHGLRESKSDLVGLLICDRLERPLESSDNLEERMWSRREIENYLCQPETLLNFAAQWFGMGRIGSTGPDEPVSIPGLPPEGPLFEREAELRRKEVMQSCVNDHVPPIALRNPADSFWKNTKASDEFLDPLFEDFLERLKLPRSLIRKTRYHELARFVPRNLIDPEVVSMLDAIVSAAARAHPCE